MEYVIRQFGSLTEADSGEAQYYASLTPKERLDILLDLLEIGRSAYGEASKGFERVYRIDELSRS
jgi:hypothetical protein